MLQMKLLAPSPLANATLLGSSDAHMGVHNYLLTTLETFVACTEADFENGPCARESGAKLVRTAFLTGPRKFVQKMCGAQFVQNIGVGLPCVRAQSWRNSSLKFEIFTETKLHRQQNVSRLPGTRTLLFPTNY